MNLTMTLLGVAITLGGCASTQVQKVDLRTQEAVIARRRNEKTTTQIVRLEVAQAGDMAYEFFNFTLSFDLAGTKQHTSFTGSGLRVWKKVGSEWQIAAAFMRPHDVPFASRGAQ